jgi:hypothetical protein
MYIYVYIMYIHTLYVYIYIYIYICIYIREQELIAKARAYFEECLKYDVLNKKFWVFKGLCHIHAGHGQVVSAQEAIRYIYIYTSIYVYVYTYICIYIYV